MKTPYLLSVSALACGITLIGCAQSTAQGSPPEQTETLESDDAVYSRPDLPLAQKAAIHKQSDTYIAQRVRELYEINKDGIATNEDVKLRALAKKAQNRAGLLRQSLAYDLNGDGAISADEKENVSDLGRNHSRATLEILFLKADSDENGELSFAEMVSHADNMAMEHSSRRRRNSVDIMAFDANEDAQVTVEEIAQTVEAVLAEPVPQPMAIRAEQQAQRMAHNTRCQLPTPSAEAEIVLLSGYEGSAISSVAVSGQDRETTVADLIIEDGDAPLFIVATSYESLVWNITGKTSRIEQLVVQPNRGAIGAGVGVTGLKKKQVSFLEAGACINYFDKQDDGKALTARAMIAAKLKQDVDYLVGSYTLTGVAIPSGKVATPLKRQKGVTVISGNKTYLLGDGAPKLFDDSKAGRTKRNMDRFYPAGVREIQVKSVLSPSPVEAYDILPAQAGLLQLISEGKLEEKSDGSLLIKETFTRFPAGLTGAHSVKFLLDKNVELPKGGAGHSSIVSLETGECVSGSRCRR